MNLWTFNCSVISKLRCTPFWFWGQSFAKCPFLWQMKHLSPFRSPLSLNVLFFFLKNLHVIFLWGDLPNILNFLSLFLNFPFGFLHATHLPLSSNSSFLQAWSMQVSPFKYSRTILLLWHKASRARKTACFICPVVRFKTEPHLLCIYEASFDGSY